MTGDEIENDSGAGAGVPDGSGASGDGRPPRRPGTVRAAGAYRALGVGHEGRAYGPHQVGAYAGDRSPTAGTGRAGRADQADEGATPDESGEPSAGGGAGDRPRPAPGPVRRSAPAGGDPSGRRRRTFVTVAAGLTIGLVALAIVRGPGGEDGGDGGGRGGDVVGSASEREAASGDDPDGDPSGEDGDGDGATGEAANGSGDSDDAGADDRSPSPTGAAEGGGSGAPVDDPAPGAAPGSPAPGGAGPAGPTSTAASGGGGTGTGGATPEDPASPDPEDPPGGGTPSPAPTATSTTTDDRPRVTDHGLTCTARGLGSVEATATVTWSDGFVDRTTAVLGKGAHTLTTTRGWTFDVTVRRALLDLALPTCDLGTATGPQRWSA